MSIDQTTCSNLRKARQAYRDYVRDAVHVVLGALIDPIPESEATAVLSFEVIHTDGLCREALADAFVAVEAVDERLRFIAPHGAAAANYVSCWHREPGPAHWAGLSPGQKSNTHEVGLLGQTLPDEIAPQAGAGYLHHVPNPADGWTVSVGVFHPEGRGALAGQEFRVSVSARPYLTETTTPEKLMLP